MSALASYMIQRFSRTVDQIGQNCIDSSNPNLSQNVPSGNAFQDVRFENTCGNRYCIGVLGFESGRVIEINPDRTATVECVHSVPAKTGNSCEGVISASPMINHLAGSVTEIARECEDSSVPNLNDNMPGVYPERFVDTCGKRYCQSRNFRDGRVIEFNGDAATLECYLDPGGFYTDKTASITAVAQNCIDSANPALANNLPQAGLMRFMSTCGDRYCREVLGEKSGKVVEFSSTTAYLTCVKSN